MAPEAVTWEEPACCVLRRTGALDAVASAAASCSVALPTVLRCGVVLPGMGALMTAYEAMLEEAVVVSD